MKMVQAEYSTLPVFFVKGKTMANTGDLKTELAKRAEKTTGETRLTRNMSTADLIKALEPEIKRALPTAITPERFTRMALSSLNTTPKLAECSQMSFLAALMNAAQLGLEPNTPLQQAFLIPYKNKDHYECQFQVGYKGLIELAYRNPIVQTISAEVVYENDEFHYELGLDAKLVHRPTLNNRGEIKAFYGLFRLNGGGFGFSVMSREEMDDYARQYSKAFDSSFSPWKTNYIAMAKKTVIKQALKYAPIKADLQKALISDSTVKSHIDEDMTSVMPEIIQDPEAEGA